MNGNTPEEVDAGIAQHVTKKISFNSSGSTCSTRPSERRTLLRLVGDSGNVKTRPFCAVCGSPVYLTFAAMPDLFTVHAASLDDSSRYAPQVVTYGVRGYAWDRVDPALPKFEKMPPM